MKKKKLSFITYTTDRHLPLWTIYGELNMVKLYFKSRNRAAKNYDGGEGRIAKVKITYEEIA